MLHIQGSLGVAVCTFLLSIGAGLAYDGPCQQQPTITVPAFTNWPFAVNCNHLKNKWKSENSSKNDDLNCSIIYNGKSSSEGIFELSNLNDNNIYETKLVVNGVSCMKSNVTIRLEPLPETCQEATKIEKYVRHRNRTKGQKDKLDCSTFDVGPMIIPEGANRNSFTTKWIVGCDPKLGYRFNKGWRTVAPPKNTYGKSLRMGYVDFCDTTTFTCRVQYKNRTLYAGTYSQCVKQELVDTEPEVFCSVKSDGFHCTTAIAFGETKSEDLWIEWKKDGVTFCENRIFDANVTVDTRFNCMAIDQSKNESLKCEYNVDCEKGDPQPMTKTIDVFFNISDIVKEDFDSNYTIIFRVRDSKGVWRISTKELMLYNTDLSPIITPIIIVGSLVGSIIVMLLLGFMIYPQRIYLFVWYRNAFKNYDKDDKSYVAYLSYQFDRELDSEQMKATEKIVMAIHDVMEELGYSFYDEQNSDAFGARVQYITNLIANSHRMVIVLTEEYLNENWKRFHAELGFHGLLDSKLGLIFILTPGVKKLLKEKARDDKVWGKVLKALQSKTQSIIHWKKNLDEQLLKRHIEYALPKLKRKDEFKSLVSTTV